MANPPCPNPEIYDAGNCCGGACFEQETPEIIAAANAGTLYPPAPQAVPAEDVTKIEAALLKLSKVGFGYDLNPHDKWALKQAAAALTASEAEAADLRRKLEEAEQKAERQWEGWVREEAVRKAAERKLEERDKRIAKLEADLAFADEQSAKVEALLEPHVQWECASEGCGKLATVHFVRGDVGSWYCRDCYMRTQAIPAGRQALESDNG